MQVPITPRHYQYSFNFQIQLSSGDTQNHTTGRVAIHDCELSARLSGIYLPCGVVSFTTIQYIDEGKNPPTIQNALHGRRPGLKVSPEGQIYLVLGSRWWSPSGVLSDS